jgi:diacylglycerol kinase (ATP)
MPDPIRPFTIAARARSFGYAFSGLVYLLLSQHNAWIHAAATVAAVAAGLLLSISRLEWALVLLAITTVWAAEAVNTAFELLADAASPERHPVIGRAKDVAAGAVLLTAIGAAVVGLLVFVPHLRRLASP